MARLDGLSVAPDPDGRALLISVWASVAFAVLALVWGLATGSQLIVFDGLYSFAGVGLSLLAVLALRTARKGPDERYPWGREVWEPLTVVVKAAAIAGLCLYALVGGVGEILAGGRDVEVGWALAYGVVATLGGVAVSLVLRRRSRAAPTWCAPRRPSGRVTPCSRSVCWPGSCWRSCSTRWAAATWPATSTRRWSWWSPRRSCRCPPGWWSAGSARC
ncbi:cation transporter [Pseudonocardia sp. 73-21]|uniref:cation transporter n=1 Tax=Pseudonocardia sp. 73-21 TaxID=1895809 RepID=UPI00263002CB|nr:cation transporter [Pseudonocardia sp. 73-21]